MIDLAIKHDFNLKEKFRNIWFDDRYKYYWSSDHYHDIMIDDSTIDSHQFVSIDKNRCIIGYIGYMIDRSTNSVSGLNIINFTDDKFTFGLDAGRVLKDIFEKFHFRKLSFYVIIGNSAEKTYDRLIERYNGRIVGIQRKEIKLYDKYHDVKLYEIFAEDYFNR